MAQDDDAVGAELSRLVQAGAGQGRADACALQAGADGEGARAAVEVLAVGPQAAEQDVAGDLVVRDGDQLEHARRRRRAGAPPGGPRPAGRRRPPPPRRWRRGRRRGRSGSSAQGGAVRARGGSCGVPWRRAAGPGARCAAPRRPACASLRRSRGRRPSRPGCRPLRPRRMTTSACILYRSLALWFGTCTPGNDANCRVGFPTPSVAVANNSHQTPIFWASSWLIGWWAFLWSSSARKRTASSAAMQPMPAAVTAWR